MKGGHKEAEVVNVTPVHPGLVLKDHLEHNGISQNDFARRIGVYSSTISALVNGDQGVTNDLAVKLATSTGRPAHFWINLQKLWEEVNPPRPLNPNRSMGRRT